MGHSWLRAAFINARERLIVVLTVGRLRYAGRRDENKSSTMGRFGHPLRALSRVSPSRHEVTLVSGGEWGWVRRRCRYGAGMVQASAGSLWPPAVLARRWREW